MSRLIQYLKKIPLDLGQGSMAEKTEGKQIALRLVPPGRKIKYGSSDPSSPLKPAVARFTGPHPHPPPPPPELGGGGGGEPGGARGAPLRSGAIGPLPVTLFAGPYGVP